MVLVYVSSTVSDLVPFREAVVAAVRRLKHFAVGAESFAAADQRSVALALTAVADSSWYVGIVGWTYGHVPTDDNPGGLSITESEFARAGELGRPRLVFMASEESPLRSIGDSYGEGIGRFRDRVRREAEVVTFHDVADLQLQLENKLAVLSAPTAVEVSTPASIPLPRHHEEVPMVHQRRRVFISYSHTDARWLKRVQIHLSSIEQLGLIDVWSDQKIVPGDRWRAEIEQELASTGVAVLLVSADFLASPFIKDNELPTLLKSASEDGCRVLTLVVGPCQLALYPELNQYQGVNDPKRALSLLGKAQQEKELDKLAATVASYVATPPS